MSWGWGRVIGFGAADHLTSLTSSSLISEVEVITTEGVLRAVRFCRQGTQHSAWPTRGRPVPGSWGPAAKGSRGPASMKPALELGNRQSTGPKQQGKCQGPGACGKGPRLGAQLCTLCVCVLGQATPPTRPVFPH